MTHICVIGPVGTLSWNFHYMWFCEPVAIIDENLRIGIVIAVHGVIVDVYINGIEVSSNLQIPVGLSAFKGEYLESLLREEIIDINNLVG